MFESDSCMTLANRQHSINLAILLSNKHKYSRKSLYACIDFADRYLTHFPVHSQRELTTVYVVSLYVGAKMEEVEFPCHRVFLSGTGINLDQMVQLEIKLLDFFNWKMNTVSIMTFFDMLARSHKLCPRSLAFAQYVAEILLYEYTYIHFKNSQLAAGIFYLVLKLFFGTSWTKDLAADSQYSKRQVLDAVSQITSTVTRFWSRDDKYQSAINTRFSSDIFSSISDYRLITKHVS